LSDFNDLNFLDGFLKNAQMSNFIKIHPVVPCRWVDRQTWQSQESLFGDLANVRKNEDLICTISAAWKLSQDTCTSVYQ